MVEIFEVLNYYQDEIPVPEERPSNHLKPLMFNNLKLHLHYDIIYYGVVA
jgi:hypothetical protein